VFRAKRETVWIVAIGAGDTLVIHLALHEGAIFIVLFLNLTVGEVNSLFQKTRHISIQKSVTRLMVTLNRMAAGMTWRARLEFRSRAGPTVPVRRAVQRSRDLPTRTTGLELDHQALGAVSSLIGTLPQGLRPPYVVGTGSVAGFA